MSEQQKPVENKQPMKKSGWYKAARMAAAVLFRTIGPVRYYGLENLPQEGPCMLICNHASWMDPVVMAAPVKKTEITFLGKKELVKHPIAYKVLTNMHMIMVDRHNVDMEAMRTCLRALKNGRMLGIFPEGTRHHEGIMTEIESGVAFIALRSGAPLIPMLIRPKYHLLHLTRCYVGKPIDYADLRSEGVNKETCEKLMDRIRTIYAQMLETAEK